MERIDWDTEIMQSFLKEYSKVYNKTLLIVYGYAKSTERDIDNIMTYTFPENYDRNELFLTNSYIEYETYKKKNYAHKYTFCEKIIDSNGNLFIFTDYEEIEITL